MIVFETKCRTTPAATAMFTTYKQRIQTSLHCAQKKRMKLECGPMPNVMVALLNIGGALCSTPQSLADAHY